MSLVSRIKHYFYRRSLKKAMAKEGDNHQTITFKNARSIGLLFDASKGEKLQELNNYTQTLKQRGFKVDTLVYFKDEKQAAQYKRSYFTNKQVNFVWVPKGRTVEQFMHQPFDLLINLYLNDSPALEYISAAAAAKYRVGRYVAHKTWYCDLMVNLGERQEMSYFIKQIEHYLNYINKDAKAV